MRKDPAVFSNGTIKRSGNRFVIRAGGPDRAGIITQAQPLGITDIVCENPGAPLADQIYTREFEHKRVYLPNQKKEALSALRTGTDVVVVGMTGFSDLSDDVCARYGIAPGAYAAACAELFGGMIAAVQNRYAGIQLRVAEGASYIGIDEVAIDVCRYFNLPHLGFSCVDYMFFVRDDNDTVYVANNKKDYSDAFIEAVQILLSLGGRAVSLYHDIEATVRLGKKLILLNVLDAISKTGGPPGRDSDGKIQDATAAFCDSVYQYPFWGSRDHRGTFDDMREYTAEVAIELCRSMISPDRAFSAWKDASRQ